MNVNPKIVFRISGDKPTILDLRGITSKNELLWMHHNEADISILELSPTDDRVQTRLKEGFLIKLYL
jgi:hypothetical protein